MPIVDVPFIHRVHGLAKGNRKWRDYAFVSKVAVRVAEADGAQAPVVLRLHRVAADEADGPVPLDLRWFGGRLYAPITDNSERDIPVDQSEFLGLIHSPHGNYLNPLFKGLENYGYDALLAEGDPRRETMAIAFSDEEVQATAIASRAGDLLHVGGTFFRHEPGLEPVYVVEKGDNPRYRFSSVKTGRVADFASDPGAVDVTTHYRVDQLSEALVACSAQHDEFADWDPEDPLTYACVMENRVEVFDASVLSFRPSQDAKVLKFAQKVVASCAGDVAKAPVGFMLAYAALRDGLEADEPPSAIVELLSAFSEHLAMLKGQGHWRLSEIAEVVEAFGNAPVADDVPAMLPRQGA